MTAARLAPHLARPGRPVLVALDLADLQGPVSGTIDLPPQLFWHPNHTFDLDVPGILPWVYQMVLREATLLGELTRFINGARLIEIWPDLVLPDGVRCGWEESHHVLQWVRLGRTEAARAD
jgi:hypothetical protein